MKDREMTRTGISIAALELAFFAASSSFASAQDAAPNPKQDMEIVLQNFSFTPSMLHLQRNTTYTLHLTNRATGGHTFSAPELFGAVTVPPQESAKITGGKIEVPAGQTVDVTFTPIKAGTYRIVCSHFLHSTMGMHGEAIVE
jgi:plastocyanin